jgi:nucleoid-associated protein YgaU
MRYSKTVIFDNDDDYYSYLTEKRPISSVTHYETSILKNPTIADRTELVTQQHVWSYGDRLYNLAHKYYGDVNYWWVIAWYNGVSLEAEILNGDLIEIPINLRRTLKILGV